MSAVIQGVRGGHWLVSTLLVAGLLGCGDDGGSDPNAQKRQEATDLCSSLRLFEDRTIAFVGCRNLQISGTTIDRDGLGRVLAERIDLLCTSSGQAAVGIAEFSGYQADGAVTLAQFFPDGLEPFSCECTASQFGCAVREDRVSAYLDAGIQTDSSMPTEVCADGIACEGNADCRGGFCEAEVAVSIPALGLPNGTALETSLFPGGACSPTPFADANSLSSCDLSGPLGRQGCGACGVCVPEVLNTGVFSMCRERCEPEANRSGCSRPGYTCDFTYLGCVEGCRSDEECRLLAVDTDLDGVLDSQRFEATSTAICDPDTFRCSHPGTSGASAGDLCDRDGDCEQDGRCILPEQTLAGFSFPGGYCSKRGCDVSGLSCAGLDSTCVPVRGNGAGVVSIPHCMLACRRGDEADPDVLGIDGHGAGCRPGYRCAWDGIHAVGLADNGICVGGNYNAVAVNNVGGACADNAECYSPYGQGQCLRLSVGGISATSGHCSIMDCAAPGTPGDLCGTGNECIGLAGDSSFCVQTCTTADECADGLACADDDGNPATASICYPVCFATAECHSGETCDIDPTLGFGPCT